MDAAAEALQTAIDGLVLADDADVDVTALVAVIAEASAIKESDYTADSYGAVAEALKAAQAVLADAEATQEEVDAATAALRTALEGLVEKADTAALEAAVAEAEALDGSKYTEDSYAAVTAALEAAKAVLSNENATQEEVDGALAALNAAVEGLVEAEEPPTVDKSGLGKRRSRGRSSGWKQVYGRQLCGSDSSSGSSKSSIVQ